MVSEGLKGLPMKLKKNILITGLPGVGKTTLVKELSEKLRHLRPVGFFTAEIREEGVRKGFELISLDGRHGLLSHVEIRSHDRVGKYKVDVKGLDNFLGTISFFSPSTGVIIIDEIGKMECLSDRFKSVLEEILGSEQWVIATVALRGSGLIAEVKNREDVKLFEITQKNRGFLLMEIFKEIKVLSA